MHGKKEDVLPFVAPYLNNEPSLLPPLPPDEQDEQGEEEQTPGESFFEVAEADTSLQHEQDSWIDQEDPFEQRHLPNSKESVPIEEEDIKRAFAQRVTHIISNTPATPTPTRTPRRSVPGFLFLPSRRKRFALLALAAVLLLLLALDGTLFLLNMSRPHSHNLPSHTLTQPVLTVTPPSTQPGQVVTLHLSNFSPSAQVLLTRDMQQAVRTDSGSSLIKVGTNGQADVHALVEDSWESGAHQLLAEDTHSHYIASVSLEVTSAFPARPPRLVVGTSDAPNGLRGPLSFGADVPEANTIQSLLLRNAGGSWIAWKATSNQPWLALAPQQGVFQDSQGVFVAVARVHLAPGDYAGTITITSNTGKPVLIQAVMTVLPPPKATSALLVVEPPLLSFTTTDGINSPTSQYLTIGNPGARPLNWMLTPSVPQSAFTPVLNENGLDNGTWLHTDITSSIVAPGGSARIQVMVQSQQLLPGVYGGILLFSIKGNPQSAMQPVAIALTVQPRCGVTSSPGSVSLTAVSGQQASLKQALAISTAPGCAEATNWQAFPQASWLRMVPTGGQLQPGVIMQGNLLLDVSKLTPGTYVAWVDLLTEMRSQTLMVQLTLLSPSATTPGKSTGSSTGSTTPSPVPTSTTAPGTPTPGPGTTPTPGTPVPQACTLQVTPARLAFTATLLQANPPAQTLALSITGNCAQPVTWTASVDAGSQGWLHLGATSGIADKNGSTLLVQVNTNGKLLGTYTGQITLVAVDHSGAATQGSPQAIPVTLTVVL
jgi:Viral BACON domain